jgi:hypothetical protein
LLLFLVRLNWRGEIGGLCIRLALTVPVSSVRQCEMS